MRDLEDAGAQCARRRQSAEPDQPGVEHIDFSINPKVERRFTLRAFEKLGSPVIPMHMVLHAIPPQTAVGLKVPLILWGENSAFEYGGEDEALKGTRLTHAWLRKFGVTNDTSAEDWIGADLSRPTWRPISGPATPNRMRQVCRPYSWGTISAGIPG